MDSDVQISRYFSKSHDPIVMTLQATGEECHLDFSKELYLSNFGDHRPSILLYKNSNCPILFCTFTINNSLFLTTVKKRNVCILIFIKRVSDLKFKLLSFLKKLYNMSSTTYIHDPLPVTP